MSSENPHDEHDEGNDGTTAGGDDTHDQGGIEIDVADADDTHEEEPHEEDASARARLEAEADRAVSEFDEGIVDLLAWLLDTETRARIYVYLRKNPHTTSEEVADGTGLYPSTVREALAELHDEETVSRRKRENAGAGNNPYEYTAIAPSDLVRGVAEQVQSELNTVFNLDNRLGGTTEESDGGPVSITVDEEASDEDEEHTSASDVEAESEGHTSTGEDATDPDDESA